MQNFFGKLGLSFALALCMPRLVLAQLPPKVSITLSGGGAKGLAHIGILKAIDSAGLNIHIVTGTSMGSIVGGLYAAGYTGNQIEEMARQIQWDKLLSNTIPLNSYIMEEKSEYGKYAVEFPFQKNKITLPSGFLESQELWLKLEELFFPVQGINEFDKLPIPFRCIGTDLKNGKAVPFTHGNLVQAIRASMAIPGAFSPVDISGSRYVDGGVIRNFPVKDAIDMGANIKIGVSVSQPLKNVEELNDAVKVLTQVVFLNEGKDREEESKLCDVLIEVPMGNFTSASFDQSDAIVNLGIQEGLKYYPAFKKLADSLKQLYPTHFSGIRPTAVHRTHYPIKEIRVAGLNKYQELAFKEQLGSRNIDSINFSSLQTLSRNAFAYRMYKSITYGLLPLDHDQFALQFLVKPEASTALKAGFHYNAFTGFSLQGNITTRNWFTPFSRSMISLNLGDNFRGLAEHMQMLGWRSPVSYRLQLFAEHQEIPQFTNFENRGLYKAKYYNIDHLVLLSNKRKWTGGVGLGWEHVNIKSRIKIGQHIGGYNSWFNAYGTLRYHSLDRPFFATKGSRAELRLGYVFGMRPAFTIYNNQQAVGSINPSNKNLYSNYARLYGHSEHIIKLSRHYALQVRGQAGINFSSYPSYFNQFLAGGLNSTFRNQILFTGKREAEISSESMVTGSLGIRWNPFGSFYTTLHTNSLAFDFVQKQNLNLHTKWVHGAGITLGYNLVVGPIEWTLMYADKTSGLRTYLNFGFPFK
ncbi:MAG TPA: patatin-like phospholipase family protein [Phnomibacter sp.]|nr:patatin-like phospholipase family protein [Phnomibacter sp.]